MSDEIIWQGSFDMLCGIYCSARLIACYTVSETANLKTQKATYEDVARNAFRNLMQSAENEGLLTAKKVASESGGGFYDYEIEAIFNGLTPRRRRNLEAVRFTDARLSERKGSEKRRLISDMGACAIIQEDANRHWITAEGQHPNGGYACFDPQLNDPVKRRRAITWKRGVLIAKPHIIESLNGQTH